MEIQAKVEYRDLKKAIKALSKQYGVKVGLLANKGGSDTISDNLDLAGLGAVQEFGCLIPVTDKMRGFFRHHFGVNIKKETTHINIPARSFLQMPLTKNGGADFRKKIKKYAGDGQFIEDLLSVAEDPNKVAYETAYFLGVAALELIQEAFDTSGWGEWAPDSELTISNKIKNEKQRDTAKPLIDTGHLRSRITFEVEKNG